MKLHAHFLSDSANFNDDGTFTIYKGGISDVTAAGFPTMCKFVMLTRIELEADEAESMHDLALDVYFNGTPMGPTSHQPIAINAPSGQPVYSNTISQFQLVVVSVGEILFAATYDDIALPLLRLHVRGPAPLLSPPESPN